MTGEHRRALVLLIATCLLAAFGLAACGGGSSSSSGSAETTPAEEAPSTESTPAEESEESSSEESASGEAELLAGLSAPSGSELLTSKSKGGVIYQHYKTSAEPKQVESSYKEQLTSAGWSIESSGGSSGGWGKWGGSDYGLTAKREDEYFDLEAGGEKNSTSYFEICATSGEGSREECDDLSNESNSNSGGSQSGSDDNNNSQSGGS